MELFTETIVECALSGWQLRPQVTVRKGPARAGFQVQLELRRLFAGS